MAKVVKKIRKDPPVESNSDGDGHDQEANRWLKLATLWNFGSCDPRFGFQFLGCIIPGQTGPDDLVVDPFGGSGTRTGCEAAFEVSGGRWGAISQG